MACCIRKTDADQHAKSDFDDDQVAGCLNEHPPNGSEGGTKIRGIQARLCRASAVKRIGGALQRFHIQVTVKTVWRSARAINFSDQSITQNGVEHAEKATVTVERS